MLCLTQFVLLLFLPSAVSEADPCSSYKLKDEPSRSALYQLKLSEEENCDSILIDGWYRWQINKEDADMPTSCPDVFSCSSTKPIWLNGSIPKIENEVSTQKVCLRGYTTCCEKTMDVDIKNCGQYHVYKHKSLDTCYGRYCLVARKRCGQGFSSESGFEPCTAIHIAFSENPTVIPVEPIHDVDPIYEKDHMLKFKCTVVIAHHARKYVFDVKWTIDGKQIKAEKNLNLASLQHKGLLTRDEWKDKVPRRLGFKVQCAIRAREFRNSLPTIFKESSEFYAGIVVDTTKLTVNAGETAFVQIHSTVPITCREIGGRRPDCFVRFEMLDFSAELRSTNLKKFCKDKKLTKSSRLCGVKFNGWQWGKSQNLTIPTKADQQLRGDFPAIVKLRSIGIDSDMLWQNYELPDIKINIRGPDFKPAICSSVTDPHITTFDGSYFTTFETGEYVLYKHTEKPIAVHVIHKSLGGPPSWNCAVAVRAASDIFIVYGCDKRWRHRRAFCDSVHGSYLDVYERNQGKEFEIHLPTGARVVINLYSYGTERYLDVHIFASTLDEKKTAGLCGIFNRRKNDDFTTPQGKVVQQREFKKSWSVKTDDSLFIAKSRGGVIARSQYFCSCVKTENGVNRFSQTANCNWDDSIKVCTTPSWSEQQCKFRHRRSTNTEENEMDIDIPEDIVQYQPAPPNVCIHSSDSTYVLASK